VCSKLGAVKAECKAVVDQYAPKMIQALIHKEDPQTVCTKVKACKTITSFAFRVEAGPQCSICEFLVKEVEAQLAKNKTEAEIIADLKKICSSLGSIKAECSSVVDQYGPEIISLLMAKENPMTVCSQIGLCKNSTSMFFERRLRERVVAPSTTPQCAICEFLVKEAEAQLAANKTEAQIVAHLEGVCAKLGAVKAECKTVVDQYAPQIIQLLVQKEDPQTVCTKVGLCTKEFRGLRATPECAICEFLIKEIEAKLASNKTESEIIADLDKVCAHLGAIKAECTAVVAQYAPQMIQALISKEDPQTVCTKVGACKSTGWVAARSKHIGMRMH